MNNYWAQWSHAEIMSMHGIEEGIYTKNDDDEYLCHIEDDIDSKPNYDRSSLAGWEFL